MQDALIQIAAAGREIIDVYESSPCRLASIAASEEHRRSERPPVPATGSLQTLEHRASVHDPPLHLGLEQYRCRIVVSRVTFVLE